MTNEPTNTDRAGWAKDALAVFTATTFSGDQPDTMDRGDLESAVGDLIADLLHYAVQQGFDPGGIVRTACSHFSIELLEDTDSSIDIDQLLASRRQVAVIWSVEDVQSVRPDLTEDQAWQVLKRCHDKHDCELGLTWTTFEIVADDLFPESTTSKE